MAVDAPQQELSIGVLKETTFDRSYGGYNFNLAKRPFSPLDNIAGQGIRRGWGMGKIGVCILMHQICWVRFHYLINLESENNRGLTFSESIIHTKSTRDVCPPTQLSPLSASMYDRLPMQLFSSKHHEL